MVNIQNFWPPDSVVPEYSRAELGKLLQRRFKVSQGFYALERAQGHFPAVVDLAMPDTQDYVRLLAFRFLEEVSESFDSTDEAHRLEELIDAMNYLLNIAQIDAKYVSEAEVINIMDDVISRNYWGHELMQAVHTYKEVMIGITGKLADTLRNRSWMVQAQDLQWAGKEVFLKVFRLAFAAVISEFPNWESFWKYFVAKDDVLNFRLESRY